MKSAKWICAWLFSTILSYSLVDSKFWDSTPAQNFDETEIKSDPNDYGVDKTFPIHGLASSKLFYFLYNISVTLILH